MTTPKRFNSFLLIVIAVGFFAYWDLRKEKVADNKSLNQTIDSMHQNWILYLQETLKNDKETYSETTRLKIEIEALKEQAKMNNDGSNDN